MMGTWRHLGRHKYGAKVGEHAGIRFQSKAEAARWAELCLLERAKRITELERQPAFPIVVTDPHGRPVIVAAYVADFRYREGPEGILVIEDVKGVVTPLYRLKKKLVEAQYGITITEIRRPRR
jgi:Protein of unknown function (DUF1064)